MSRIKRFTSIFIFTFLFFTAVLFVSTDSTPSAFADTMVDVSGLETGTLTQTNGKFAQPFSISKTSDGFYMPIHSWTCMYSPEAIAFNTPLTMSDIANTGGLSIRMYAHLSPTSPFGKRSAEHGIYIYGFGTGITGAAGDAYVEIPTNIIQDEWIDFTISPSIFATLVGSDGVLKGLQFAFHIQASTGASFYITNEEQAYITVKSISFLNKKESNIDTSNSIFVLTGMENPTSNHSQWGGMLTQFNGLVDTVGGTRVTPRTFTMIEDEESTNGWVYSMTFHSWGINLSSNVIVFNRALTAEEYADGLLFRIKAHLSAGSTYLTGYGGIVLLPLDSTGNAKERGYLIPADIPQDSWTNLRLSADEAAQIANADGKIYGFQIGAYIQGRLDSQFWIGPDTAYLRFDYVATYENKTLSFHNADGIGGVKAMEVLNGFNLEYNYYYPPTCEDKLFAGWYEGENLSEFTEVYDFTKPINSDIQLTARWIDLASEISDYYGVYRGSGGRFSVTEDGIDLSGLNIGYYDECGIGEDSVLYAVSANNVTAINLNSADFERKQYKTISYYAFGKKVCSEVFAEDEDTKPIAYTPPQGYNFIKWVEGETLNSNEYAFGGTLENDISLYAVFTHKDILKEGYTDYYGVYYCGETRDKLILGGLNSAQLIRADGTKNSALYYILNDGGFAFLTAESETSGLISRVRLELDGKDYFKLTSFTVSYQNGTDMLLTSTVDGGDYTVQKPENPTRNGCEFLGWYTALQGGSEFDFSSVIYHNTTLYARWKPVSAQATKIEDGSGSGCSGNAVANGIGASLLSLLFLSIIKKSKGEKA